MPDVRFAVGGVRDEDHRPDDAAKVLVEGVADRQRLVDRLMKSAGPAEDEVAQQASVGHQPPGPGRIGDCREGRFGRARMPAG